MKNLILSLGLLIAFCLNAHSQAGDSQITIQKKRFYQNGQEIKFAAVKPQLAANPASAAEYKKYKTNSGIAIPFLAVGTVGVLAGPIINFAATAKQADEVNNGETSTTKVNALPIILAGAAVGLVGVTFTLVGNSHLKKSLNNFNESKKGAGLRPTQFDMMVNSDGVGVRMKF
jgi:hypothetical protein